MSTVEQVARSLRGTEADPFRYGWRYVPHPKPGGGIEYDQVPLSLEDVLHPQMGDVVLENTAHDLNRTYLSTVLRARLANHPSALVGSDLGVYWDIEELRHHSPDISVILGVHQPREFRSSFNVSQEGVRPALLIELVSPNTRVLDVETKVVQYHQAGVPQYVIVDQERERGPLRVIGYRHEAAGYVEMEDDAQGRVLLECVKLLLGVRGERVVLFDAATGQELGDYEAIIRQSEADRAARQAAEEQARVASEARRHAEEQARAEAEARRHAEEQARAEAEARRLAEDRLRALEEELKRLRGE